MIFEEMVINTTSPEYPYYYRIYRLEVMVIGLEVFSENLDSDKGLPEKQYGSNTVAIRSMTVLLPYCPPETMTRPEIG